MLVLSDYPYQEIQLLLSQESWGNRVYYCFDTFFGQLFCILKFFPWRQMRWEFQQYWDRNWLVRFAFHNQDTDQYWILFCCYWLVFCSEIQQNWSWRSKYSVKICRSPIRVQPVQLANLLTVILCVLEYIWLIFLLFSFHVRRGKFSVLSDSVHCHDLLCQVMAVSERVIWLPCAD